MEYLTGVFLDQDEISILTRNKVNIITLGAHVYGSLLQLDEGLVLVVPSDELLHSLHGSSTVRARHDKMLVCRHVAAAESVGLVEESR